MKFESFMFLKVTSICTAPQESFVSRAVCLRFTPNELSGRVNCPQAQRKPAPNSWKDESLQISRCRQKRNFSSLLGLKDYEENHTTVNSKR